MRLCGAPSVDLRGVDSEFCAIKPYVQFKRVEHGFLERMIPNLAALAAVLPRVQARLHALVVSVYLGCGDVIPTYGWAMWLLGLVLPDGCLP